MAEFVMSSRQSRIEQYRTSKRSRILMSSSSTRVNISCVSTRAASYLPCARNFSAASISSSVSILWPDDIVYDRLLVCRGQSVNHSFANTGSINREPRRVSASDLGALNHGCDWRGQSRFVSSPWHQEFGSLQQ